MVGNQLTPTEDEHVQTFKNAAHLMQESLDLEEGGGVVFLDTSRSTRRPWTDAYSSDANSEDEGRESIYTRRPSVISMGNETIQNHYDNPREKRKTLGPRTGSAQVLAAATTYAPDSPDSNTSVETRKGDFKSLSLDAIKGLVNRYPRGQLWVLSVDGQLNYNSEEDSQKESSERAHDAIQLQLDANLLLAHFPGALQLILLPLWDARSSRWCACIAYSTSMYRTFTYDTDFICAMAFCNCISTEMARLNISAADHQKGGEIGASALWRHLSDKYADFIGSISHELRSPLHGECL